jgi:glyoxylate utilization-related uncharacterized protein
MVVHSLKCWPEYFQAILDGKKSFEVRKDDRGFRAGDILHLQEWSPETQAYCGRETARLIVYTLTGEDFGIREGFIVMGLEVR